MSPPAIHPTAIVDPAARVAPGTTVGPYTVIEGNVVVDADCEIGPHVLLASGTRLEKECRIFKGASIGTIPQDLKFGGEDSTITVGAGTTVREFCTLNRGTKATGETRIGAGCLLMAYCHIAHDCRVGNNVVIANNLAMAGHVEVGNNVNIGGVVAIHQFVRIGDYAFVGAKCYLNMDVPPFSLCGGEPARVVGVNKVGLERKGFSAQRRSRIKRAFRVLFREERTLDESLKALKKDFDGDVDIEMLVSFSRDSSRGLLRM